MATQIILSDTTSAKCLVSVNNGQVVTTSLQVAEFFGKSHNDVLKSIKALECSDLFRAGNFSLSCYVRKNGNITKSYPMYYMTRDGFTFLAMGFTGKIAAQFKEAYISAFNAMEKKLRSQESRKENKELNDLRKDLEFTQTNLKYTKAISQQEADLKNSCFFFLVAKGLYTEYHQWLHNEMTKEITKNITKELGKTVIKK